MGEHMIDPERVARCAQLAFVLEAVSNKPGCTTRYMDLPGKPLSSFLVAGVNAGSWIRRSAEAWSQGETSIFVNLAETLRASRDHASGKIVNFGLLEILFLVAYARCRAIDGTSAIDLIPAVIVESGRSDVECLLAARKVAWSTSTTPEKQDFQSVDYVDCMSVQEFYTRLRETYPETSSNRQWAVEIQDGSPVLRMFFDGMPRDAEEILSHVERVYPEVLRQFPLVKKGIIADMCAAAIFLGLMEG